MNKSKLRELNAMNKPMFRESPYIYKVYLSGLIMRYAEVTSWSELCRKVGGERALGELETKLEAQVGLYCFECHRSAKTCLTRECCAVRDPV